MTGKYRANCNTCGSNAKRCHWADPDNGAVIARCRECGANFDGPGVRRPLELFARTPAGLSLTPDPHYGSCAHGDDSCPAMPWEAPE